jgi:hypothetical protein
MFNTELDEDTPSLSADGLSLYYAAVSVEGYGYFDLYVSTRPSTSEPWGPPENVGEPVNTGDAEGTPFISPDGLSLFFTRGKPGPAQSYRPDLYVSQRKTISSPWGSPRLFTPVQMPGLEFNLSFSGNDSALYFNNGLGVLGLFDLWKVEVTLVVDFNADGVVDALDVLMMAENWGVVSGRSGPEASLCDIAPFPWGDGVVDAQDLLVLAKHMIENVEDVNDMEEIE